MEHQENKTFSIAAVRVSSQRQNISGDSLDQQRSKIESKISSLNTKIIKWFEFTESAAKDQPFQKVIDYCKSHKGKISYLFVVSIDRFTRGGSYQYSQLTSQLKKYGVQLIDVHGIISENTVNTLGHLNIEFSWSKFQPSSTNELLEAEKGKDELRTLLTRLIDAEITYVRMGYAVRAAPFGFKNERIDTIHGKRIIRSPNPPESEWIIKMFEMRAKGSFTDEEIVKRINLSGFRSRQRKLRSPMNKNRIIGITGGIKLTIKQMQKYIPNPVYAGINAEKWMSGSPIKAKFKGLVSIDLFNAANHGKITIHDEGDQVTIYKGIIPEWQKRKNKDNPLYPYKKYVSCPICRKALLGSASRNKVGKHIPRYHCSRNHPYWSVNKKIFDDTIDKFVRSIIFQDIFKKKFKEVLLCEWEKREKDASSETITLGNRATALESEIRLLKDKIKSLNSPTTIALFEEDIEKLQQERASVIEERNSKEKEQVEIQEIINYSQYFMEHLHELLLECSDPMKAAALFGLIFEKVPSYDDLKNGTPELSPLFALNQVFNQKKNQSVSLERLELSTISLRGRCSTS